MLMLSDADTSCNWFVQLSVFVFTKERPPCFTPRRERETNFPKGTAGKSQEPGTCQLAYISVLSICRCR